MTCPALAPFINGERILEFGDGTGYGTVFRFECVAGFRRIGAATLLCLSTGEWSFAQPYCKSLFNLLKFFNISKIKIKIFVIFQVK